MRRQDLNGDHTVEPSVEGAMHLTHAASTQRRSTLEELLRFKVCCRRLFHNCAASSGIRLDTKTITPNHVT